jgi:DNA-binding CsgD family transcriptional regulator
MNNLVPVSAAHRSLGRREAHATSAPAVSSFGLPFAAQDSGYFYMAWQAFAATVEVMQHPSAVFTAQGHPLFQNSAATRVLASRPELLRIGFSPSGELWAEGATVVRLTLNEPETHYLISWPNLPVDVPSLIPPLTREWSLTRRQTEVLTCLVRGDCNKLIATALNCAVRTVELHVSSVLEKSGTASRAELISKAWRLMLEKSGG